MNANYANRGVFQSATKEKMTRKGYIRQREHQREHKKKSKMGVLYRHVLKEHSKGTRRSGFSNEDWWKIPRFFSKASSLKKKSEKKIITKWG